MIEVPPARIPEEPGAVVPHAGICKGGRRATGVPTLIGKIIQIVKSIDGIWHSSSAGYLVFDTSEGYVVSAFPCDEFGGKYVSFTAWLRELEEYVVEIKLCNLARSCDWQRMCYRTIEEYLHWHNGRKDFILDKITESEVCDRAKLAIERATAIFLETYAKDATK